MTDALSTANFVTSTTIGIAIWIPVLSSLTGGFFGVCAALLANRQSHKYALERDVKAAAERLLRDKEAQQDKIDKERYFLATELVFKLERFGEESVSPAKDKGDHEDEYGYSISNSQMPELAFEDISGDWRSLPPQLMYRLRELEVLVAESKNAISDAYEFDDPPNFTGAFFTRQQYAVKLGLQAFILAAKLRRLCSMPAIRRQGNSWFAPQQLWELYRKQRKMSNECRINKLTLKQYIARESLASRPPYNFENTTL